MRSIRKTRTTITFIAAFALTSPLAAAPAAGPGTGARAVAERDTGACTRKCLIEAMADFKSSMLAGDSVTLAPNAEVRENMELEALAATAWTDVGEIRSSMVFADPATGNIVSRDGVAMSDGKPAYISTRLQVEAGRINEVEISSDLARANPEYVWSLPAILEEVVPEEERMTREELHALARRYFQSLSDHKGVADDFDDARCNRFHSGVQVTNVERETFEGRGSMSCFTSIDGPKPWGPAVEQRYPVIDVERGVVMGLTLLLYTDQVMYVSEIFKVIDGKIVHIDNIGLVKPGRDHTTGFGSR